MQETILLVDDQPENIAVLYDFLKNHDYKLLVAQDGKTALEISKKKLPDLVLLDIMMPEMNGLQVCKAMQSDHVLSHIPVIFMTALAETNDKLDGFAAGAVDYITKPFHHAEVLARIRSQLTIRRQYQELEQRNSELDAFAHTVAHDLKNPAAQILGSAQLIDAACQTENIDEIKEYSAMLQDSAHHMQDIIDSLLLLASTSSHNQIKLDLVDLSELAKRALHNLEPLCSSYNAQIIAPESWPALRSYGPWLEEVWMNYISNALKYGGSPPQVELGFQELENQIRLFVKDNGHGLSDEQKKQLFVPFKRLHTNRAEGHGLGLSIVAQIANRLNGEVGLLDNPDGGSIFYIDLPILQE